MLAAARRVRYKRRHVCNIRSSRNTSEARALLAVLRYTRQCIAEVGCGAVWLDVECASCVTIESASCNTNK
jgi:hypothetical protein